MRCLVPLALLFITTVRAQQPDVSILQQHAPASFRAVLETSRGNLLIEVKRAWSPLGADRLYQLIRSGFFRNSLFFRVEKNNVAQFGVSPVQAVNRFWDKAALPDEPAKVPNAKGMIAFATGTKNGRRTQLFINLADHPRFNASFTPVARVVSGMEIAARLESRYGRSPALIQDSLYKYGNFYFEERFPLLDRITGARIVP